MLKRSFSDTMILIGSVFAAVALLFVYFEASFVYNSLKTTGTVVGYTQAVDTRVPLSHTFRPRQIKPQIVFAQPDGQLVKVLGPVQKGSHRSWPIGAKLSLRYLPGNTSSMEIDSFMNIWGYSLKLGGIAIVLILLGTVFSNKKGQLRERLMQEGEPVAVTVSEIRRNASLSLAGYSPYRIIATWHDPQTHVLRTFKSHNLWRNPKSHYQLGDEVIVYLHPRNRQLYYMDVLLP